MALLQRSFASGSIWVGTGSSAPAWNGYYSDTNNSAIAVYSGSNPLLLFNINDTDTGTHSLILQTASIKSNPYIPGFSPTHASNLGFAIRNDSGYYTAQFDNINIRGAMNVHQFVINQIRSTNGDLWVSDAAKATAAISNSANLVLHFESGSLVPFIQNDIIRSKRINPEGASINSWDIIVKVTSITSSGATPGLTASLTLPNYWTSSGSDLGNLQDSPSSQWVRIGNTSTAGRRGGLYLSGGGNAKSPFMDIYDGVATIAEAHDSTDTSSVSRSKLVSRFGNLQGFSAGSFGDLSGYGLWASGSVYLEGKIIAREGGTISNWTITDNSLSAGSIRLTGGNAPNIQIGAADSFEQGSGIFMSGSSGGALLRIGQESGSNAKFIQWDNSDLIINSSNFRLAGGNITAKGGTVGGWNIGEELISGSADNTNIAIRTVSSSDWNAVTNSGVDYADLVDSSLFGPIAWYFDTADSILVVYSESAYHPEAHNHKISFTSSHENNNALLARFKPLTTKFNIPANKTVYFGFKEVSISSDFLDAEYSDTIWYSITSSAGDLLTQGVFFRAGQVFFSSIHDTLSTKRNIFFSYTNNTTNPIEASLNINLKSLRPLVSGGAGAVDTYDLYLGDLVYGTSSGYTQLNPHGLLVWAGPSNYVKLTTQNNKQYAIVAVDQLYVGGQPIKGGTSGGGGTSAGIDGAGHSGSIPAWSDSDTIVDSIVSQNGDLLTVNGDIITSGYIEAGGAITSSAGILVNGGHIRVSTVNGTISAPQITASSGIETVNLVATGTNNNLGTISTGTWNGSTIAVNKGGTGQTSYTNGQLLIGKTTGNTLEKATLTQGTGVSITNGAGSITIAIGQSVATTVSPTFAGITLSNLTPNTLPIASTNGKLINSQITDNGSLITLGRATYVNGNFQAYGTASATQITASIGFTSSNGYLKIGGAATSSTGFYSPGKITSGGLGSFGNITTSGYVHSGAGFSSSTGYLRIGGVSNLGLVTASAFSSSGTSQLGVLNLTTDLTVANGGTGRSSFTQYSVLLGSGENALDTSSTPSLGTVFIGTATKPSFSTKLTLGGNIQANGTASFGATTVSGLKSNGIISGSSTLNIVGTGTIGSLYVPGNTQLGNEASDITSVYGTLKVINAGSNSGSITSDANGNLILDGSGVSSGVQITDGILWLGASGSTGIQISSGSYGGSSYYGGMISSSMKVVALHGFANRTSDGAASFEVDTNGNLECYSLKETSLRQYKHEIHYITESQLLNISKLKPVTFLYNIDNPQDINDTQLRQAGFIAEQVQQIYPEVAWYKQGKLAGLQYQRLTAYLTRGIQELAEQNKLLKSRVQSLEQLVNGILQGAK